MPEKLVDQRRAYQILGVALSGMDKIVARIYERKMRPEEFQYGPWLDRVLEQLAAAFNWLEDAVAGIEEGPWLFGSEITQADITTAVAWRFLQFSAPGEARPETRPSLVAFGERAEYLPEFEACPLE